MKSIVKVPNNAKADYDFIAFSFNGKHSVEDFHLYRIAEANLYQENITDNLTDYTADDPVNDGQYFFGSKRKNKIFNINFAFYDVNEPLLKQIKQWLNTDEICDLWFAEAPHRVYPAKITGNSIATVVISSNSDGQRVYNGRGNIQFTCYDAHAHTPDIVVTATGRRLSGNAHTSYVDFSNYNEIKNTLPLKCNSITNKAEDSAFGDLPFYFKAKLLSPFDEEEVKIQSDIVGETYIIEGAIFSEADGVYIIN